MQNAEKVSSLRITWSGVLIWLAAAIMLAMLGAHFLRRGEVGLTVGFGLLIVLAAARPAWLNACAGLVLVWGGLEWLQTLRDVAGMQSATGQSNYVVLGVLLLLVGLTALSGVLVWKRAKDKAEDSGEEHHVLRAVVFLVVFLVLFHMRQAPTEITFMLLERYFPVWGSLEIFLAALYAGFVAGKLVDPALSRKSRRVAWLLFGCVFYAQFFLGLLGMDKMLMTGNLHVPIPAFIIFAPVFRTSFSIMPIILVVSTLVAGTAWCSILCYFGCFDSWNAGLKPVKPYPAWLKTALRYGRPAVLALGVAVALILRLIGLSTPAAVGIAVLFAMFSVGIMIFVSRKYQGMVHCTTFCPMGLVANFLGKISLWRLRVDQDKCDNCGACSRVCKYQAIDGASRAKGRAMYRCTLCRDCIPACRNQAIYIRCPGLSREKAHTAFSGTISVMHTLFLVIAMV